MKKLILLFVSFFAGTWILTAADLMSIPGMPDASTPIGRFAAKFNDKYRGEYNLQPTRRCGLPAGVKTVFVDIKENEGKPSMKIELRGDGGAVLGTHFFALETAKVDPLPVSPERVRELEAARRREGRTTHRRPEPVERRMDSLLWEQIEARAKGGERTIFDRLSFHEDTLSFDTDKWLDPGLWSGTSLEDTKRCNFTKVIPSAPAAGKAGSPDRGRRHGPSPMGSGSADGGKPGG